jgi:spore coat polysaccharide biosynthesis protein SpsF (cytidylyltransferase family)
MQYWDDGIVSKNDELYHFGILGMKWGVRRYQNEDGTLTPAGKARYIKEYHETSAAYDKDLQKAKNGEMKTLTRSNVVRLLNDNNFQDENIWNRIAKEAVKSDGSYDMDKVTAISNEAVHKAYSTSYLEATREFNKSNKHYQKLQSMLDKYAADDLEGVQQTWDEMENRKKDKQLTADVESYVDNVNELIDFLKSNPDAETELREIAQMELDDLRKSRNT